MRIPSLTRYVFVLTFLVVITACSRSEPSVESGRLVITLSPSTASLELDASDVNPNLVSISEPSVEQKGNEKISTFELMAGSYTLSMSAEGYQTKTIQQRVRAGATVNTAVDLEPVPQATLEAVFSASPEHGDAPLKVTVDASGSGEVESYVWDFGDDVNVAGVSPESINAEHIYTEPGSYRLSLTVTDGAGDTATSATTIVVNAPPTAAFTATPVQGKAPLEVSFDAAKSSDSDGKITNYSWDFGDGSVAQGPGVEHTYTDTGAFEAVLSVTDDQGSTRRSSEFIYVDVVAPKPTFSYSPGVGTAPLELSFDGSSSSAGTNDIVKYHWDLGDGSTAEGKTVKHFYKTSGVFTVELTITDSQSIRARTKQLVTINGAPTAAFSPSVSSGQAPLKVSFDASQSSDPEDGSLSYEWLYEDERIATGERVDYTFTEVGSWTVQLRVTDEHGASHTTSTTINVKNAPPKANFTVTPDSGFSPLEITADASSSSDANDSIKRYTWDFGDGTTATGKRVTHTYSSVDNFNISLIVTDEFSATASRTKQVTVNNRPPTASFSLSRKSGKAPLEVAFDATDSHDDGPTLAYEWDFGGGVTKRGKTATHTFTTEKQHTVKLTVTDNLGAQHSQTQTVTVTPSYRLEPLSLASDGRSLRSGSEPFFWLADTAWLLWTTTEQADVIRYLDDAQAKGFNVVQVAMSAVWSQNGVNGENLFGDAPYIGNDPTQLNPPYFDYVEWVIDEAAKRGLYTMITFGEPGRAGDARVPYRLGSNQEGYAYGHALGQRFKAQTLLNNIVWTGGQDYSGGTGRGPELWSAISEGVTDGVNGVFNYDNSADYRTTFMGFHGPGTSSQWFHDAPWLDFNGVNNWKRYWNIVPDLETDWQLAPTKPSICLEQSYEFHNYNGERRTDWHVRFQGYWCALSGAAGYAYGHLPGYRLAMHEGWFDSLQSPGRYDMLHLKNVLSSRPLSGRIPDQSLITSDDGVTSTAKTYIAATRASNGSYAFVYSTEGSSFDLNLNKLSGNRVKAQWFNPRDGSYTNLGTLSKGSSVAFNPPGEPGEGNDWLLVLDAIN